MRPLQRRSKLRNLLALGIFLVFCALAFTGTNGLAFWSTSLFSRTTDADHTQGAAPHEHAKRAHHDAKSLQRLFPLPKDFAENAPNRVTPTATAAQDGDWNDPNTWVEKQVPRFGALVHIPENRTITAQGNISNGDALFLIRVDGQLNITAPNGTRTRLTVDTLFATGTGHLNIDASNASDGTIDIVITPFDIEAHKANNAPNWDRSAVAYYSDGAAVSGWLTKQVAQGGQKNAARLDPKARITSDGAGVLGRYNWDPEQLTLGVISAGKTTIHGKSVSPYTLTSGAELDPSGQYVSGFYVPSAATKGWALGSAILATATTFRGIDNNDLAQNAHAYDKITYVKDIEQLADNRSFVQLADDHPLAQKHFAPNAQKHGKRFHATLALMDRNVTFTSAAAQNPDKTISRATSINNPLPRTENGDPLYKHLGINGNLSGQNGHLITQRGHFMAMHRAQVSLKNVNFSGFGRTDKSALIDDFKFYGTNFVGSAAGQGQFQDRGAAVAQGGGRLFKDTDNDEKYSPKIDTAVLQDANSVVNMRGRYAVHLHQLGVDENAQTAWLENLVVNDTPSWGIVQHSSAAVLIGNVTYNAVGAGFVAESGNEAGLWLNNLSAKNTGFVRGAMDRTVANDINDIARQGIGFWFAGKNIAAFDNTVTGSDVGYSWEPYGIDNVKSSDHATALTNTILRAPSLRSVLQNASIEIDPIVDHLTLTATHINEHMNTNLPIRYFAGNTVTTSRQAIEVTTDPDLAAQKFNDVWSIFKDTTAWEVAYGMNFNYTSKYIIDGFDLFLSKLVSVNNPSHRYNRRRGIKITNGTSDFVLKRIEIAGHHSQVDEVHHSTLLGGNQRTFGQADLYAHSASFYSGEQAASPNNIYFTGTAETASADLFAGFASDTAFYALPEKLRKNHPRYNPYYNFYGILMVGDRLKINSASGGNIVEGASYRLGGEAFLTESDLPKNPFFRVLSDRFLSDGFDVVDFADRPLNAGLSYGFAEETTPQGVSIKLVNTSASHGVVALWREHLDVRENYDWKTAQALPLLFQNDHWVRDHLKLQTKSRQLPQFVLPHVNEGTIAGFHGLRRFDQTTGGFRKDVWSGALLEFDKTDGYGSQRFAYEDRLVDRNGDGKAEVLRAVTHNERIVFTRAQIDAALQENGYVTLKGAEYTNAQGQITPLRFVLMQTIFTDRVDGRGHIKTVLVALDTEWGGDGFWDNIQTAGILTPAQIKEQSIIAAPNYGVYSAGALKDVLSL